MKARHSVFAIGLAFATLTAVQAQAAGSLPPSARSGGNSSTACDSARLSAWFDRQRQLTDGDVDPQKPIATPVECLRSADNSNVREQRTVSADTRDRTAMPARTPGPRG